jgi:rod shape determining protein RodA
MSDRRILRDFDWLLVALALAAAAVGIVEIYSATRNTPWHDVHLRQMVWVGLGLLLLWICSTVDYHWLVEQSPAFYALSIAGLAAILLVGPVINGSQRWLALPGLPNLQISEFVKVVLVLLVARHFSELPRGRVTPKALAKMALLVGVPMVLVMRQPDLSTSLSYLPIAAMGLFLAGLRWKYVAIAAFAACLVAPLAWRVMPVYQRERLTAFVDPEKDPRGKGYQSLQSKIAVGSGGIWGQGFARGSQTQLRFLPEAHTDFIFASFAEESGFVGVVLAMGLYFAILMRIVNNAQTAADAAGMHICMGVAALLLFHILVNVGMVVSKMPVTGIPLPLMSYGGSSAWTTFLLLGLVNNVRLRRFAN